MADKRIMSIERKYDGEYCQIHIDRSSAGDPIQIFSKSGKDSTKDRTRLHGPIKDALALDREGCKIREKAVLEGELLVWNTLKKDFEPFHHIRNHVMHGGHLLGRTSNASPPRYERVMIVFYDILLLDDKFVAKEPHAQRRQLLKGLMKCISGSSSICERVLIGFTSSKAPARLRSAFAQCIKKRWEGLVLKGNDDPYVSLNRKNCCIKFKKDYISSLGETAELCIVGASRSSQTAAELSLGEVAWTNFHIATLENGDGVRRGVEKPAYAIVDTINPEGMSRDDLFTLNARASFLETPFSSDSSEMTVKTTSKAVANPTILFKKAIVVEIMGAGFDKNTSCSHWILRFPRLMKLHFDRDTEDVMSLKQLQQMTETSSAAGSDDDAKEEADWIERLLKADGSGAYVTDKSQSTTPGKTPKSMTTICLSPVSSRRSRPPTLIRIDTAEMTAEELLNQGIRSPATTTTTTPTPPTSQCTGSKRNFDHIHITPTLKMTNKRPRLSQVESSPVTTATLTITDMTPLKSAADGFPSSSPPLRPSATSSRGGRVVVKPPPSGQNHHSSPPPSDSLAASVDLGSSPVGVRHTNPVAGPTIHQKPFRESRKPLAEMTNVLLQLSRRTVHQPARTPLPSPIEKQQQTSHSELGKQPVASEKQLDDASPAVPPIFPFLPTPPTSSEESVATKKENKTKSATMRTRAYDSHPPIMRAAQCATAASRPLLGLNPWKWPIYISPSLARSSNALKHLMTLLRHTDATYTFSLNTFTSHISDQPLPGQTWVVLVDAEHLSSDRDQSIDSPTTAAQKSPFPSSDVQMTGAVYQDSNPTHPQPKQASSSPDASSLSSTSCTGRPSIASTILTVGQALAHVLSRSSYTDTMGNVIPPINMQAADILIFDYRVLGINVPESDKDDEHPGVSVRDIPKHLPLGLDRRPMIIEGPGDGSSARINDMPFREQFVACLRYDNTIRDGNGKRAVRVIWDWDEVMRRSGHTQDKGKGKAPDTHDAMLFGSQTFGQDILRQQYERLTGPGGTGDEEFEKLLMGSTKGFGTGELPFLELVPDMGFGAYGSPEQVEARELVQGFQQRMQRRDGEFEREQARLREVNRGTKFELWDVGKQRRIREGVEKRKRDREGLDG